MMKDLLCHLIRLSEETARRQIMKTTVNARGLSCPQTVLMTIDELKKTNAPEILVLVDTEASKENVSRAVER